MSSNPQDIAVEIDLDKTLAKPKAFSNAWFEIIFDTLAWDIVARALYVITFGYVFSLAVSGLLNSIQFRQADGWFWLEMAFRTLGIINVSLPILIVIIRLRPVARSHGLVPKMVALAGTFLPSAFGVLPYYQPSPAVTLCSGLFLVVGGVLTLWTWPYLGRSYSLMAEARKLTTHGPYRFVRHPLYLFEEMSVIGVYLLFLSPVATVILAVQIACQLLRIENEEGVLSRTFAEYRAYQRTTWKLIPGIY